MRPFSFLILLFTNQILSSQETLSKASEIIIKNGIQFHTWISHSPGGDKIPTGNQWEDLNLNGVTFYDGTLYNLDFFKKHPNTFWSIQSAPFGSKITESPQNSNHFLNKDQLNNINNLTYIGFGDEESYSTDLVINLKNWFNLSRRLYPNVLVHNNRCHSPDPDLPHCEWTIDQLKTYFQECKPDILTFDWYYYSENQNKQNPHQLLEVFNNLHSYRKLALGGYDGSGRSPIVFGQYLLGYKTGKDPQSVGNYVISESQIFGVANATLLMGGKWLNIFRYLFDHQTFIFYDQNGVRTEQYWYYSKLGKHVKHLSPFLTRLNSTGIYFLPGEHKVDNNIIANAKPDSMNLWKNEIEPHVISINVENLGSINSKLKGDVIIGRFSPLPGLKDNYLPAGIKQYYMIMNGLTSYSPGGTSKSTLQRVSVRFRLNDFIENPIKKISRETGEIVSMPYTKVDCNEYIVDFYLGGGDADLFYWDVSDKKNIALGKRTKQSSTFGWGNSNLAVDDNTNGDYFSRSVTHTNKENAFWEIDLNESRNINEVQIWGRTDCCGDRLRKYYLFTSIDTFPSSNILDLINSPKVSKIYQNENVTCPTIIKFNNEKLRYLRIQLLEDDPLSLSEVKIFESKLTTNTKTTENYAVNITLSPNPTINNSIISLNSINLNERIRINVYDINGRKIINSEILPNIANKTLDMSELPSGVYFVNLYSNKVKKNFKLIKI